MTFEDIAVGHLLELGSHHFTAEEIIRVASAFDPQPFHIDPEAAARSIYGGLIASGHHTASAMMKLYVRALKQEIERSGKPSSFGPSPGVEDLRWPVPVRPGDTITYASTVIDKRVSASRPGWGLIRSSITGHNQKGELVFSMVSNAFVKRASSE